MWTTIVCTVIIVICLQWMASRAFMACLKKVESKQRKIMDANKGKCLETIKEESKDPKEAVNMAEWIDGMQQIVTTVLFMVEEHGSRVGNWSLVDMVLLLNKFNDCASRNSGKEGNKDESN